MPGDGSRQIDLLIRLLESWWRDGQRPAPKGYRTDFYISGNLTVYYSAKESQKRDFRGPDVFVVLGTEKRDRRSWVLWEEGGKYPTNESGRLSCDELGLGLGIHGRQLCWFTADGRLISLPEEAETQAREQAEQRAERLEAYLRSQGIDPDQLPE